jgi:hypothetical protein
MNHCAGEVKENRFVAGSGWTSLQFSYRLFESVPLITAYGFSMEKQIPKKEMAGGTTEVVPFPFVLYSGAGAAEADSRFLVASLLGMTRLCERFALRRG